ncbi:SGNH/GDSL hydrolase family protein [Kribbella sp. NPDC051770]|uniref:GDSL-type esterase/lipase family protein n=1 Tax=Kribbella sp. NPDC051770 TaxID=3155413 RepID=UPI0034201A55
MPQWISTPITAELVRGAIELEKTEYGVLPHRLGALGREQNVDGQLAMAEAQPSGVRVVFRTAAAAIELDVLPTKMAYVGVPARPDGIYDLLVDGELAAQGTADGGNVLTIDFSTGSRVTTPGPVGSVRFSGLPAETKDVEIWLPYAEITQLVALRTDAPVEPTPATGRRTWLHHGSSISHGSNADSPTGIWPALAARQAGVELVSTGFGGSALLDPFTARTLRDTPADLISVKLGINLVNTDLMRLRALGPAVHGFLDTIREGHPTTPLLVISSLHCAIHEHTPGPLAPDFSDGTVKFMATGDPEEVAAGKLTLTVIREELARVTAARAAGDPNLHHLDGLTLYGEADEAALPLPDRLHPDAATHRLIADRFVEHAFLNGPFAEKS